MKYLGLSEEQIKKITRVLDSSEYIILKLGTSTLAPHVKSKYISTFLKDLAVEIKKIQKNGKKVIIVSSGAVGAGVNIIQKNKEIKKKLDLNNLKLQDKQALAAIGQSILIEKYRSSFQGLSLNIAQVLVTRDDFENKIHLRNLKNTIRLLLNWNIVPIINENDTIATAELNLKVGDNDTLSALLTNMFSKSILLMFSSVFGLYKHDSIVSYISSPSLYEKFAGNASLGGTGGMKTKLKAAELLLQNNKAMCILHHTLLSSLSSLIYGDRELNSYQSTWFIK